MGKNRILCHLLGITEDTNKISGDSTPMPTSHRILDYVKDIEGDTDSIAENGGGGGGGGTGTPAGFGTPTAEAESLEAGAEATASVTAEGPDTAKIFHFNFGIPKGEKGERGDTGPQGEKGDTGAQGVQGEPGAAGAQGAKGDTGAAAGFGTPTATATQLESTEQPTVQVSASGDDTAKVFAFTFGIPKGEKGDTGAQGEQGEQGIQGEQGEPGAKGDPGTDGVSAGFGTPTATATPLDAGSQPTVSVQATGGDTAKVFAFSFGIPKGEKGEKGDIGEQGPAGQIGPAGADGADGVTPTITATAEVDNTTGTPTVQVTKSGTETAPSFKFSFTGIKGETGAKGDTGSQGAKGDAGTNGVTPSITANATVDDTVGTPNVQVTKQGDDASPTFNFAFTRLKGETGAKGDKGDKGDIGPQGPQGDIGPQGVAAGFGTPTASASALEAGASPTVSVQASGADTAKVFAFTFGIPKGEKGDTGAQGPQGLKGDTGDIGPEGERGLAGVDGVTPSITATATVDSTMGTPAVQVTKSGTDETPSFQFSFTGLKGETGAQGIQGPQGPQGEQGPQGPAGVPENLAVEKTVQNVTTSTTGTQTINPTGWTDECDMDVYINGFFGIEGVDYSVSSTGTITTLNSINSGAAITIVIRKYVMGQVSIPVITEVS